MRIINNLKYMGLGDLLFSKNTSNIGQTKSPVPKKMNVDDVEIAQRSYYTNKRDFVGRDMRPMKKVMMNDARLDKKAMLDMFHKIAVKNRRDLTFKDLKKHLENYQRYNIKMSWVDKQKFLNWVKCSAEKELPAQRKEAEAKTNPHKSEILEKKAEKLSKTLPSRFISPKNQSAIRDRGFNVLGIKNVQSGFQRGHNVNPTSMGMDSGVSEKRTIPRGFGPTGALGVGRGTPRPIGGGGLNLIGRPKL